MKSAIISMSVVLFSLSRLFGIEDLVIKDQSRIFDNKLEVGTRRVEGIENLQISYAEKEKKSLFCVFTIVGNDVLFEVVPESSYWASCRVTQVNKSLNVVIRVTEKGSQTGWIITRKGECSYSIEKEQPGE